jgi:hypothetical protein
MYPPDECEVVRYVLADIAPAAGTLVTGVLAQYLAATPAGP